MKFEEHGDYYIEQRTVTDPSREDHQVFDVGHLVGPARKRLKHRSFWNYADAVRWIESQPK